MKTVTKTLSSVEGRSLVSVTFERESEEASTPVIEVIFEVFVPNDMFRDVPSVLTPLSTTRTDTREAVTLTPDERRDVIQVAAEKAAEMLSTDD